MKKLLIFLSGIALSSCAFSGIASANITLTSPNPTYELENYTFFASSSLAYTQGIDATTTNATSTNILPFYDSTQNNILDNGYMNLNGASRVTLYFTNGGATATNAFASSTFSIQVTPDFVNWYAISLLGANNVATSSSQLVTGTSTTVDSLNLQYNVFAGMRCIVVIANGANATCRATSGHNI